MILEAAGPLHANIVKNLGADEAVGTSALPQPDFVKLDVDGNGMGNVYGAAQFARNLRLGGLIVEPVVNYEVSSWISELLERPSFLPVEQASHGGAENVIFAGQPDSSGARYEQDLHSGILG